MVVMPGIQAVSACEAMFMALHLCYHPALAAGLCTVLLMNQLMVDG
jgi:hypothetical protein